MFLYSVRLLQKCSEAPECTSRAAEKHIVLHSACLQASGSFRKDQCCCSEMLSRWVITSELFYILLMDTLLKLTHSSLHSTFSHTLLESSSNYNTSSWWCVSESVVIEYCTSELTHSHIRYTLCLSDNSQLHLEHLAFVCAVVGTSVNL